VKAVVSPADPKFQRDIAQKLGIAQSAVKKIVNKDLSAVVSEKRRYTASAFFRSSSVRNELYHFTVNLSITSGYTFSRWTKQCFD
jgi:hypothetical protein